MKGYERVRAMDDAFAAVSRRLRIQKFEHITSIQVNSAEPPQVVVQTSDAAEVHAIATYFGLREPRDLKSGITVYDARKVVGLHGATVEVFGPTQEDAAS